MKKKHAIQSLLLIFISFFSICSFAVSCNEKSPNYIKEGEKYYESYDVPPLTRAQKDAVKNTISSFDGKRLKGHSTITECIGSVNSSKKKISNEKLEAEISVQSDGQIMIDLDIYNENTKTQYNDTLKYFGNNNAHVIKTINRNEINIVSKYRRAKHHGKYGATTILIEEIAQLSFSGNTLNIITTRYMNGYFSIQNKSKLYY